MKSSQISIAIVDDCWAIREMLVESIQQFKYVEKIESFANSKELFAKMYQHPFDLVILDVGHKYDEAGLDICNAIKNKFKHVKVLIYSNINSSNFVFDAYQNNADGYLCKDARKEELVLAVDKIVLKNEKYFSPKSLDCIFQLNEANKKNREKLTQIFTHREIEVLELIKVGKSNKEIARMFNRSSTTVIKHRYNILRKIHGHKSLDIFLFSIKKQLLYS